MTVKITLGMSPEDAERFMQAFKDGKLAEFNLLEVKLAEPEAHEAPAKSVSVAEVGGPKKADVPPRV